MENQLKVTFIGLGGRGMGLMRCLLRMKDVHVVAVCDTYLDRAEAARDLICKKQGYTPFCTTDDELAINENADAVLIATSWEDHIKLAIAAMKAGKFVGLEVGGAYNLQDCFDLVAASEETGKECMLLENCCYGEYELMALRMARAGFFGNIVHCEGGYCHDLRSEVADGEKNRHYRLRNYMSRNCENYPTHELGPIAKLLNVNNGNRFVSLASFAGKSEGLKRFIKENRKDVKSLKNVEFAQADIVQTFLRCENGETVSITLDTTLPRPYCRHFTVRGTRAMYEEDNNMVFEDIPKHRAFDFYSKPLWNNGKKYKHKYAHPLWENEMTLKRRILGHGGMDWLVLRAMVETAKKGAHAPVDVYDAATLMAVTALSEQSIKNGNAVVEFPDFTGGKWKTRTTGVLPEFDL